MTLILPGNESLHQSRGETVNLEQASNLLWGTTAQQKAYGQRSLVENANNLIKYQYAHLNRSFTRLFGLKKRKFVLAFLLAGVNRKIAESWELREAARPAWEGRKAQRDAAIRGERTAPPSPAALRQRRKRAADRLKRELAAANATTHRPSAPRPPART